MLSPSATFFITFLQICLLKIDEVADISSPAKDRYVNMDGNRPHRCLKLSLTDGKQRFFGMEYVRIPSLSPSMPAGTKALLHNVTVRRGLLLLTPENTQTIGGKVESLEGARQRALQKWNEPPRGREGGPIARVVQNVASVAWPVQEENQETHS